MGYVVDPGLASMGPLALYRVHLFLILSKCFHFSYPEPISKTPPQKKTPKNLSVRHSQDSRNRRKVRSNPLRAFTYAILYAGTPVKSIRSSVLNCDFPQAVTGTAVLVASFRRSLINFKHLFWGIFQASLPLVGPSKPRSVVPALPCTWQSWLLLETPVICRGAQPAIQQRKDSHSRASTFIPKLYL